jgi:hypothetical protein
VVQYLLAGAKGESRGPTLVSQIPTLAAPALPALPQFSELDGHLHQLVASLDDFGRIAPSNAVASLYCHLSHWPSFLAIVHTALSPLHESGALRSEQERVLRKGRDLATARLLPLTSCEELPAEPSRSRASAAIESFTGLMIARMLVMGTAMLELLPDKQAS